jgi:hypothetical protein
MAGTPCCFACSSRVSQLESAESPATCRPSPAEMTSSAWVPIDPVEPSTRTRFTAPQCRCRLKLPVSVNVHLRNENGRPFRASRHRESWVCGSLANLDGRELELMHLQVPVCSVQARENERLPP